MTSPAPGQDVSDDSDASFAYSGTDWAFDHGTDTTATAYMQTLHCVQPSAQEPKLSFSYHGEQLWRLLRLLDVGLIAMA